MARYIFGKLNGPIVRQCGVVIVEIHIKHAITVIFVGQRGIDRNTICGYIAGEARTRMINVLVSICSRCMTQQITAHCDGSVGGLVSGSYYPKPGLRLRPRMHQVPEGP